MTMTERRPGIGDNTDAPDWARLKAERLQREYSELLDVTVPGLVAEAEAAGLVGIANPEQKGVVTSLIKRIRDAKVRILGFHEVEKQQPLREGQAVDQVFFGAHDKLGKRDRKHRDGIGDVLQNILTDYDNAVLAAKQAALKETADKAAAAAAKKAAEEAEAKRLADEAEAAAARARNPVRAEEKNVAAAAAATTAALATAASQVANAKAEDAHIATLAKPADLMRERGEDGTLSTMGAVTYALVESVDEIDDAAWLKLRPYFKLPAIEQAVSGFARATDYRTPLPGCKIGRRPKSIVR